MHRLKDLGAPERLFQLGTDEFPPLRSLNATNLPAQPDAWSVAPRRCARSAAAIDAAGIVTLTGPGGTGKTRLGLQAAAESIDRFGGGVFWVPLAAIRRPEPGRTDDRAGDRCSAAGSPNTSMRRQMLLLLDNLEQLLPQVRRAGRPRRRVPESATAHHVTRSAAGRRRKSNMRSPRCRGRRGGVVRRACLRHDARWKRSTRSAAGSTDCRSPSSWRRLGRGSCRPDLLLARLDHALPVLTGGRRDAPERQQTLRATIAWSYDLLSEDERRLFDRLGVFVGGFTLEAAERIARPIWRPSKGSSSRVSAATTRTAGSGCSRPSSSSLSGDSAGCRVVADSGVNGTPPVTRNGRRRAPRCSDERGDSSERGLALSGAEIPNLRAAHADCRAQRRSPCWR